MRILIYSETEAAKAKRDALREQRHHASLRNPQFFDAGQFDRHCDLVIADSDVILNAYRDAGIETERLTGQAQMPAPILRPAPAMPEPVNPDSDLAEAVTTQPHARRSKR